MEESTSSNVQNTVFCEESKASITNMENDHEMPLAEDSSSKCGTVCEENASASVNVSKETNQAAYEVIIIDLEKEEQIEAEKDQQKYCDTTNTVQEFISEQNNHNVMCETKPSEKTVPNEVVVTASTTTVNEKGPTMQVKENSNKISSLDAIALEYESSDSDTESSPSDSNKINKTQESSGMDIEILSYRICKNEVSSSSESESEDDSSSNSDSTTETVSDDSDTDSNTNKKDRSNNSSRNRKIEMKNEWDDLPPIEDLKITVPEVLCEPLGEVAWMVEQLVVVHPKPGKPTLNLDTVLFVDKGKRPLGKIFDVFGQVSEPYYCVRFNSTEHIKESDIEVGMTVYFCPNTQYTTLVFLHELTKIKGTDGGGDDEPPEFSDDEEEQAYYEMLKQKQSNVVNNADVPFKRKRTTSPTSGWQSNHPWNRNASRQKKDSQNTKRDKRQFNPPQNSAVPYNGWSSVSYQNNWPPAPRHMHPAYADPYVYGPYLNPMQYINPNESNHDQNFQDSQNNYPSETNVTMGPRVPFNVRYRFPPSFGAFGQSRPNVPFPNMRFRYPDTSWQAPQSRMHTPWVSLPPPPPPPPPSTGTS